MHLEVVTPSGVAVTADADEVTAPGVRGEFGVLPGHTPFISALRAGVLSWRRGGQRGVMAVGPGFAEISGHDRIVVLAQSSAKADEIDGAAAQRDLDDAERILKDWKAPDAGTGPTREEIEAKRDWAQARLNARATR
jgi:F-type H+-transporting ATPase subunit epsilon